MRVIPLARDNALWCSDLCFIAATNALCLQIIICDQHMFKQTLQQAMEAPGHMHTQVRSAVSMCTLCCILSQSCTGMKAAHVVMCAEPISFSLSEMCSQAVCSSTTSCLKLHVGRSQDLKQPVLKIWLPDFLLESVAKGSNLCVFAWHWWLYA